LPAIALPLGAD